jgi:hypothetical protein
MHLGCKITDKISIPDVEKGKIFIPDGKSANVYPNISGDFALL